MKKILALTIISGFLLSGLTVGAQQDKSKRASPPATVTQKLKSGATITINYSQPSLKGRTIGVDVEPMKDQVWRMGANEATTFETDQDIEVEGKKLAKGKYSLFGLWTADGFEVIFNSATNIWGTQWEKNKDKDVLRIKAEIEDNSKTTDKLTYVIEEGEVKILWGKMEIEFDVK